MKVRESEKKVYHCLDNFQSFCFDAGPGSGKTYTLEKAIEHIILTNPKLSMKNQKILCVTYTNAAKNEILERLGQNSEVLVSTIHDFLWSFISSQTVLLKEEFTKQIENELKNLENKITKSDIFDKINDISDFESIVCLSRFKDIFYKNYGKSAQDFRKSMTTFPELPAASLNNIKKFKDFVRWIIKKDSLKNTLGGIEGKKVKYDPTKNRDQLSRYRISHDTLLEYCNNIIEKNDILKRLFSDRYPFVLVDEYQDTNEQIVKLLKSILEYSRRKHNFVIGYFGDSKQNIYDQGVGTLSESLGLKRLQEKENKRSCKTIVEVINRIRNDGLAQTTDTEYGTCRFYVTDNSDKINEFDADFNSDGSTVYLYLKNTTIAEINGYAELRKSIVNFPHFSNGNYDNLNNEFFQNNVQNIGWFLREVLNLIDFKKKIENPNTTVKELIPFITLDTNKIYNESKLNISFGTLKLFLSQVQKIPKVDITLADYIQSLCKIDGKIKGNNVISNIFSTDENASEIKLQAINYFYNNLDIDTKENNISEEIDKFFNIELSQFESWYDYVYREKESNIISYRTLHGSKGLEFDNVVVVLQDDFAKRHNFFKFFFENYNMEKKLSNKERIYYEKARNLLYVACSRAKTNLCVIYEIQNFNDIKENIEKVFGEIHKL